MSGSEMQKSVTEMLDRVGLHSSLALRYPHELSGGQAQRVAIARALMLGPAVLICDEALTALDGTVRREILKLLTAERERSGLSLVLITHDLGVVREISDRVYVMHQGKVCETATNERLFSKPEHAYTKELLRAVPRL
jgi:ABC-type oligopeptide transport system ATPase subunit